jgi:two-component system sensor kinase FixL
MTTAQSDHPDPARELEALRARVAELEAESELDEGTDEDRRTRETVDAVPFPALVTRREDGRVLYINDALANMIDTTPEQVIGRPITRFYTFPEQRAEFIGQIRAAGWFTSHELACITATGRAIWVSVSVAPVTYAGEPALLSFIQDITDRKKAERQLHLTQFTVEHAAEAIMWFDGEGRLSYANDAACRLLGYELDELTGLTVADIDPGVTLDSWNREWDRLYELGGATIESTHHCKDGTTLPVEITCSIVELGERKYACAFIRDITERKQAEQLLELQRDLAVALNETADVNAAVDHVLEAAARVDGVDSGVLYLVSDEDRRLELVGHRAVHPTILDAASTLDPDHPAAAPVLDGRISVWAAAETPGLGDVIAATGLEAVASLPIWHGGQVIAVLAVGSSEPSGFGENAGHALEAIAAQVGGAFVRLKAEQALVESEAKFRSVFEHAMIGIEVVSPRLHRREVNPAMASMLGYSAAEIASLPIERITHPDDVAAEHQLDQELLRGERDDYRLEKRFITKTGETVWAITSLSAVRDAQGDTMFAIGLAEDITGRREAEEEIREVTERYRRLVETSPHGIQELDLTGRILFANAAMHQLLGYGEEELAGHALADMICAEDRPTVLHELLTIIRLGRARRRLPVRAQTKEGRQIEVEIEWGCHHDRGGHLQGLVCIVTDVTARNRADRALRESEARYRLLADHAFDIISRADLEGVCRYISPACRRMLGYAPDELMGASLLEYIHPDDLERARVMHEPVLGGLGVHDVQFRARRADGTYVWLESNTQPVRDPDTGEVAETIAVSRDITRQRAAEEALRESEQRYRAIVEAQSDAVCKMHLDGVISFANEACCRLFETPRDRLIGRGIVTFMAEGDRDEQCRRMASAGEGEFLPAAETRIIPPSGQVRWIQWSSQYIRDADGRPIEVQAVGRDVTERRAIDEERREALRRLNFHTENSPLGIVEWDRRLRLRRWSPAAERIFGWDAVDVLGSNIFEMRFVHEEDRPVVDEVFGDMLAGRRRRSDLALRIHRRDGRLIHTRWYNSALVDKQDESFSLASVIQDVTEQVEANERIRSLQDELTHVSRLTTMGEMTAGLAHELNQPLAAIANYANGCVSRIRSGRADEAALIEVMERVAGQAEHAGQIIRRLGSLVRKGEAKWAVIDLNATLRDVLELVLPDVERRGIELELDLAEDLPPVVADSVQLQQVAVNVLRNACDALVEVEPENRRIILESRIGPDARAVVSIKDTGQGISEDLASRLFDPFFTTKPKGLGMGLAICRTIVEAHGGELWYKNRDEGGTAMCFSVPIAEQGP